jgi:hypothetical protein
MSRRRKIINIETTPDAAVIGRLGIGDTATFVFNDMQVTALVQKLERAAPKVTQ